MRQRQLADVCPMEVHEEIKADPVRLATEARPIGGERHRLEGLAWFNCRRCESTLVVQVPKHDGEECPAPLEEHGPTFTLPSVDLC